MRKLIFFLIFFLPYLALAEEAVISIQGLSTDEELLKFLDHEDLDQITLSTAVDLLIAKHSNLLKEGIEKKSFKDEVYAALWNKRSELPLREAFILTKHLYGVEAFFLDLPIDDIKQSLSKISTLIESDVTSETEKALFTNLYKFIQACSEQFNCEAAPSEFVPEAMKYSYRLQNAVISRAILHRKLVGLDALKLLAQTKYVDHRTPDTYKALLFSLRRVLKLKSIAGDWKRLPAPVVDFISFMSQGDIRIAELIYGSSSSAVDWQASGIGISILIIVGIFIFIAFTKNERSEKREILKKHYAAAKADLVELNVIWNFFDLPSGSDLSELKRRYIELASELHPDIGCESSEEFIKLNSYYKRAMDLLKS